MSPAARPLARARRRPALLGRPLRVPRPAVQRDLPRARAGGARRSPRRRSRARRWRRARWRGGRSPAPSSSPSARCRRTPRSSASSWPRAPGRRPLHAVPGPALAAAGLPARRPGARAAHRGAGQELGQPVQQVGDPPDPGPAVRLERDAARRGAGGCTGSIPRQVVVTGAQCFDEWFEWQPRPRAEFAARVGPRPRPAVRALRLLLAVDRPVGGRLRPPLDARRCAPAAVRRGARRARPPASEAARRVGRRRHLPGVVVFPQAGHAPTDDESKARLLRLDLPLRRRRRPEHERDDRGGDRRPAGADGARPRVRARAAGDAPLPLPARGRRRAAHRRADARGARGPARAGDRGRATAAGRSGSWPSSSGRTASTWSRRPLFVDELERFAAARLRAPSGRPRRCARSAAAAPLARAARVAHAGEATRPPMRILFQLALARRTSACTARRSGCSASAATTCWSASTTPDKRAARRRHLRRLGRRRHRPAAAAGVQALRGRGRAAARDLRLPPLPRPAVRGVAVSAAAPREATLDGTLRGLTRLPYGSRAGRAAPRGHARRWSGSSRRTPAARARWRGSAPDVVVVSPLIGRSSRNRRQTDTVKAARQARRSRPSFGVGSWDHLTTKGVVKARPDATLVWNDLQRRDAPSCTRCRGESVVVTGAQLFDPWFDRAPGTTAGEFAAKLGLPRRTSSTSARRRTSRRRSGRSRSSAGGSRRCARATATRRPDPAAPVQRRGLGDEDVSRLGAVVAPRRPPRCR